MKETKSLIKEVPGHLFTFEEKIWGMSLMQLFTDLGTLISSITLTGSFPLALRILCCGISTGLVVVLVHGKTQGMSLGLWIYLSLRLKILPTQAVWRKRGEVPQKSQGRPFPSVQETWIPFDTLERGLISKSEQRKHLETFRCWMVFELEGKNVHLLPEQDQIRIFQRFESFLSGLEFHIQFLSHTEQINPGQSPALLAQHTNIAELCETPHLQALQQASLSVQEKQITTCTRTRHFLVITASSTELALQNSDGSHPSLLSTLTRLISSRKPLAISHKQVREQLQIRASVVKKAIGQLDMRIWELEDHDLVQIFASCLAPGAALPTFLPEENHRKKWANRSIQGLHGTFYYMQSDQHTRFDSKAINVVDLLSPSRIELAPDMFTIEAGEQTRYTRTFTITGYGHHIVCGWVSGLTSLGLPMLISSHFEPIDSRFMILKLEQHLTKLESKRLADQKTLRLTKADQSIEAEQVRALSHALAAKQVKIFDVSLTICLHASDKERLEQRSRYLLSHLRDMQIQARTAFRQQDLAWQSCLPTGLDLLQRWVKLPSDAAATFLPGTSGVVGTPTGVFLGYTHQGLFRKPVYFHPWSQDKKIANPHVVVVGESGMGKSWLGKTLVTGFLGMALADVIVLDKDDDYQALHQALPGESQSYNLARSCPINLLDLPFGPDDVDPDDPTDMLSEFFDNTLLTGISLLVTDEGSRLSKMEEALLIQAARSTYAAKGITSEAIRHHTDTLLLPPPTLTDFIAVLQSIPTSSESMRQSLSERLEKVSYLFGQGQTSISLKTPLTIFRIRELDEKWYALMTYVVQNFLMRHRALNRDTRYLAYVVEEASYLLRHPAGRRYLESGSRGFRKLGIAQITLSQHPQDFLEHGQVVLSNAGTAFFLGMQRNAAEKLNLPEILERTLVESVPGQCVMRIGNEYAPLKIWNNPVYKALFTTDPAEQKALRLKEQQRRQKDKS